MAHFPPTFFIPGFNDANIRDVIAWYIAIEDYEDKHDCEEAELQEVKT